jgi:hypothetical protein
MKKTNEEKEVLALAKKIRLGCIKDLQDRDQLPVGWVSRWETETKVSRFGWLAAARWHLKNK